MPRTGLEIAIKQIEFARGYTRQLLEGVGPEEWFALPPGQVSHLAWQVGHLAMAQYALTMLRIRGKEREDASLISKEFFRCFQKGSQPAADPSLYPSPDEILGVFERVHQRALQELAGYTDEALDVMLPEPHAVFETKLGSIFFCSAHEMLHAGQIGLIRRLLGKSPLR